MSEIELQDFSVKKKSEMAEAYELATQDIRSVTNLKKDKFAGEYDKERYNVESVQKENERITFLLEKSSVKDKLDNLDRARLMNVQNRNAAFLLVNEQKFSGDSTEMTLVKDKVTWLEGLLENRTNSAEFIGKVELKAFDEAIDACKAYLEKKHPRFETGKRRRRKVEDELKRLQDDLGFFKTGMAFYQEELKKNEGVMNDSEFIMVSGQQVLHKGREIAADSAEFRKDFSDHYKKTEALTEHFAISNLERDTSQAYLNPKEEAFIDQVVNDPRTYMELQKTRKASENEIDPEHDNPNSMLYYPKKLYSYIDKEMMQRMDIFYNNIKMQSDKDGYFLNYESIQKLLDMYQNDMRGADTMLFLADQILKRKGEPGYTKDIEKKALHMKMTAEVMVYHADLLTRAVLTIGQGDNPLSEEVAKQVPDEIKRSYIPGKKRKVGDFKL